MCPSQIDNNKINDTDFVAFVSKDRTMNKAINFAFTPFARANISKKKEKRMQTVSFVDVFFPFSLSFDGLLWLKR